MSQWETESWRRLGYHPVATDTQRLIFETNRAKFIELFDYIQSVGSPSRELSLSLKSLQEALMWLNAHVACNKIGVDHD
jgi:hypothetical protein